MSGYIILEDFLDLFPKEKPISCDDFVMNARVRVRERLIPLHEYLEYKNAHAPQFPRQIQSLFDHIMHREVYLRQLYRRSFHISTAPCDIPHTGALQNVTPAHLKNHIRALFFREIFAETQSGCENIPTFFQVLYDLYQYPDCIIDYKLLTPSALHYSERGRIGSVFSSFYFRASIMNPALVHTIRMRYFPNARRILTPTMGWCSYLIGCSYSESPRIEHYVGIDVIASVCHRATHTPLGVYPPLKRTFFTCPSEQIHERHPSFITEFKHYFDVAFFSPPYYKMELYSGHMQSTTLYPTYDAWLSQYWKKTMALCRDVLHPIHGILCYIVSPFDTYDLPHDLRVIAEEYFVFQQRVPIYNKNVRSTKHREPDEHLYIFTSHSM